MDNPRCMSTIALLIRLALTIHPAPQPSTQVTYLDLSGPAEDESPFPAVVTKGRL
jgi:hypothetical protein